MPDELLLDEPEDEEPVPPEDELEELLATVVSWTLASSLVTDPAEFDTTTAYVPTLSAVMLATVKLGWLAALVIAMPPFCH